MNHREHVEEQLLWMETCGATLCGYIQNYGTKGLEDCSGNGGIAIWRADCAELRRVYENLGFCISNASFERMLQGKPDTQAFKSYAGHFLEPMGVH